MKARSTIDIWEIDADYGYGDGWETVHAELSGVLARRALRDYLDNYPTARYRIVKRRERINPAELRAPVVPA